MNYKSKGYVFDEDVTAWLDNLKAMHGSYNKGLRLVAFNEGRANPAIDVAPEPRKQPKKVGENFQCGHCPAELQSLSQLDEHLFSAHGLMVKASEGLTAKARKPDAYQARGIREKGSKR